MINITFSSLTGLIVPVRNANKITVFQYCYIVYRNIFFYTVLQRHYFNVPRYTILSNLHTFYS